MSRPLGSFADLSMKVVGVRTADNSDFWFELPASVRQLTASTVTPSLEPPAGRRRDPLVESLGWFHGGLNE